MPGHSEKITRGIDGDLPLPRYKITSYVGLLRKGGVPILCHRFVGRRNSCHFCFRWNSTQNHMPRKWSANPPESPRRCWKSHRLCHDPGTSWAKSIHPGKLTSPFSTGNTSSNSGFSIVMLVFWGYVYYIWTARKIIDSKVPNTREGMAGTIPSTKTCWKNHSWIHLQKFRGASHAVLNVTSLVRTRERPNLLWGGQMIGDAMMAKSATKARDLAWLQKSEPQTILSTLPIGSMGLAYLPHFSR